MLIEVAEVKAPQHGQLWIKFEDGVEGTVTVTDLVPFDGIFEPLADPAFFEQVYVHPELGTIVWPNGADLDPVVLYSVVSGIALPSDRAAS